MVTITLIVGLLIFRLLMSRVLWLSRSPVAIITIVFAGQQESHFLNDSGGFPAAYRLMPGGISLLLGLIVPVAYVCWLEAGQL